MSDAPPDSATRKELIRLQKRMYRENRAKILDAEDTPPALFQEYEDDYNRATRDFHRVASWDELVRACRTADIVYVGDYHTLVQSQKTFLKLVKRLGVRPPSRLVVALEFVQGRFQKAVDAFLAGRIQDRTFLKRIDYRGHWPYDIWDNYRPIFEHAKDRGHRVLGIECNHDECNTLHGRDSYAGWRIAEVFHEEPKSRVVVLIGELHVSPDHLPAVVRSNLEKIGLSKSHVVVYQNSEQVYWKLFARGNADETDVVQIDEEAWCVTNTPPIVRQRSYLDWIEYDEGALEYANLAANFKRLATAIARFLRIRLGRALSDLTVVGPGETDFLAVLERSGRYDDPALAEFRRRVEGNESIYLPAEHLLYLARLSTNFAGEEAAAFVKQVVSGWRGDRPVREAVYAYMLHEALAFFGSKVINHKRKCDHERAWSRVLTRVRKGELADDADEAVVASLVVTHKRWERGAACAGFTSWFEQDERILLKAVRALGNILGEQLYYALVRGKVTRPEVRDLFEQPFRDESETASTYFHWVARVGRTRIPKRI